MAKYQIKFTTYGKPAHEIANKRLGVKTDDGLTFFYAPEGSFLKGFFRNKKAAEQTAKKIDTLGRNAHFGEFIAADVVEVKAKKGN